MTVSPLRNMHIDQWIGSSPILKYEGDTHMEARSAMVERPDAKSRCARNPGLSHFWQGNTNEGGQASACPPSF